MWDVVVIGGGGSGLAAATAAAQVGAKVAVLEREEKLGGTTALSVGSIAAAQTRYQKRKGIADSVDAFHEDLLEFARRSRIGEEVNAESRRELLATEAGVTVEWLHRLGVRFAGPFPEAPHRVPRMHNAVPSSRAYIDRLSRAFRRDGGRISLGTSVVELNPQVAHLDLIVEGRDSRRRAVRARTVVVAAGDFSASESLRERFLVQRVGNARPLNPTSDGTGLNMLMDLDARVEGLSLLMGPQLRFAPSGEGDSIMERFPVHPLISGPAARMVGLAPRRLLGWLARQAIITHVSPSEELFRAGAFLVDSHGREVPGQGYERALELSTRPLGMGHIIAPSSMLELFNGTPHYLCTVPAVAYARFSDLRRGRPDLIRMGNSVDELATGIGVRASALKPMLDPVGWDPPLIALGPVLSVVTVTEGGVVTDKRMAVVDTNGRPIPRVYAAGSVAHGGVIMAGHGTHLAWAFTSGRIAGQSAASKALTQLSR